MIKKPMKQVNFQVYNCKCSFEENKYNESLRQLPELTIQNNI